LQFVWRDEQLSSFVATEAARPSSDEQALVARARAGEDEAWKQLYGSYYDPIYRYLRARSDDITTAEDLAADVFVAAVRSIERYRGERPVLAWLFGIARHIALDHARRRGRRNRFLAPLWRPADSDADPAERIPSGARPADEVVVERLDLMAAMRRLSGSQREVVALRYFAGLTTAEIAVVMRRDSSAVYSLHARALLALRKLLAEEPKSHDEFRPPRATTE
jgi:RNA polymerase sigma factor (sigma-70 family)